MSVQQYIHIDNVVVAYLSEKDSMMVNFYMEKKIIGRC